MTTFFCLSCNHPSTSELGTETVPCTCGGLGHRCCDRCHAVLTRVEALGRVCNECLDKDVKRLHRAKRNRRVVRHDALPRAARRFGR